MIFHAKIGILGEYLYVSHTLFIHYLERNHTLFGEKLYFIWKFSIGNTDRGGGGGGGGVIHPLGQTYNYKFGRCSVRIHGNI